MTEEVQKDWMATRAALNEKLMQFDKDYNGLSKAANISYWAARRFILSGAKNQTTTATKLCEYFGIPVEKTANPQIVKLTELTDLVAEVWDGTAPHADLLIKLIKSTKPFKIQERAE